VSHLYVLTPTQMSKRTRNKGLTTYFSTKSPVGLRQVSLGRAHQSNDEAILDTENTKGLNLAAVRYITV
jgi:hypothetical protein